ncbi:MAG: YqaE/Pmp3 family membrane protein [Fulvivirga sp.]
MKNRLYHSILTICLIALVFGACSPKYGAHFNNSTKFYETPALEKKKNLTEVNNAVEPQQLEIDKQKLTASKAPVDLPETPPKVKELVKEYEAKAEAIKAKELPAKEEKRALKKESKKVKKQLNKELKKNIKALKQQDADADYVVMMILAIIIPPLGVGLTYGITGEFWLSLILTIIFWLPGAIYSAIVVHKHFRG